MSKKKSRRRDVAKRPDVTVGQQQVQDQAHASEVSVARFRSGPLPSAEEAAAYEHILR